MLAAGMEAVCLWSWSLCWWWEQSRAEPGWSRVRGAQTLKSQMRVGGKLVQQLSAYWFPSSSIVLHNASDSSKPLQPLKHSTVWISTLFQYTGKKIQDFFINNTRDDSGWPQQLLSRARETFALRNSSLNIRPFMILVVQALCQAFPLGSLRNARAHSGKQVIYFSLCASMYT